MYTSFYGLREKPFALSPDPRFLYLASSHREALAHLLYGIEQGEGFISVTGEVGTGKTTLCRTLLERLDGDTELAFLFNPSRTAVELLQSICAEFELPAEGLARRTLMNQLNNFLLEQKQAGRRVLLIIDEAQTLTENTLEQVRLLSNLETSREKLIQILLLGQPELDRKLDGRGLRQLRQRISVRWQLEPLGADETIAYVRHRLSVAAGEPKDLFTEPALREIHRRTGGIPRLVNQLCDRTLLAGYAERAAQIGPNLVRAAAAEIPDTRLAREAAGANRILPGLESLRESFMRPWMWAAASLAVVGLSLFAGLQVGRIGLSQSMRASLGSSSARDPGAGIPPSVGANSPSASGTGGAVGSAAASEGPPISDLIAFVPPGVRKNLRLTPGQVADGIAIGTTDVSGQPQSAFLAIPSVDAVQVSALAPGLLPDLLRKREAPSALLAAESALLGGFGRRIAQQSKGRGHEDLESAEDLRERIESRGLAATTFEGGSIGLLRQLDHPVALPLVASPGADSKWITVTGFDGDRARIAGLIEGRIVTVASAELEAHWLETGIIVWERFERVASQLRWGDTGGGVTWLQHALAELRVYTGRATGKFDDGTYAAVARFQREQGLVADGVAGPLTQIALYAKLLRYPVPRLSSSNPAPAVAIASPPAALVAPASDPSSAPAPTSNLAPAAPTEGSPAAANPSPNEPKNMRAGATPHSSLSGDRG